MALSDGTQQFVNATKEPPERGTALAYQRVIELRRQRGLMQRLYVASRSSPLSNDCLSFERLVGRYIIQRLAEDRFGRRDNPVLELRYGERESNRNVGQPLNASSSDGWPQLAGSIILCITHDEDAINVIIEGSELEPPL